MHAPGETALVLPGGGARAAYQVGVLAGIGERAGDDARFPVITGVSAGSINAASLAAYPGGFRKAVFRLEKSWRSLSLGDVFDPGTFAMFSTALKTFAMLAAGGRAPAPRFRALLNPRPLRRMLDRYVKTEHINTNIARGRLRALGLSATSYGTGRTVTFVHAAEDVPMWERAGRYATRAEITTEHVMASSALPLVFPAVPLGDGYYADGSIRQMAPLAPAIHLGACRLLAISARHGGPGKRPVPDPPPARMLGMLLNAVFLESLDVDAERLERVNRSLAAFGGRLHPEGLQPLDLLLIRPSQDLARMAADLSGHLPSGIRFLLRGMGSSKLESPDFLSYLLFERPYIERLIDLGREDAGRHWPRIEQILDQRPRKTRVV